MNGLDEHLDNYGDPASYTYTDRGLYKGCGMEDDGLTSFPRLQALGFNDHRRKENKMNDFPLARLADALWGEPTDEQLAEAARVDEEARLDPDEVLDAVLDYRQDMDPIEELQLLAFDDEEVAARLEMMGYPLELVEDVKAAAARALPGDDPGPY